MAATTDHAAQMGALFQRHGPAVYRRALRLLGNPADAEEATQEVFFRAFRGAAAFQGQSQLTTWLYRITTNYCLNQIRDQRRRRALFAENFTADERPEPASPSDLCLVHRLLSEVAEEEARVAIYIYMDGMTHAEVADLLSMSRRQVARHLAHFQTTMLRKLADPVAAPAPGPRGPGSEPGVCPDGGPS